MLESTKPIDIKLQRKILGAIGDTPDSVYPPGDDSFLMLDAISGIPFAGSEVLDVGTGSGLLGLFCAIQGATVTATDVNEIALHHAHKAADKLGVKLRLVLSDLFSNVQGRFDCVLFNPPYLPSTTITDPTVDGGPMGVSLVKTFLDDLPNHLKTSGTAFLLLSSLNDSASLIHAHPEFEVSPVAKRSLFFEELQVLHLRFRHSFPG